MDKERSAESQRRLTVSARLSAGGGQNLDEGKMVSLLAAPAVRDAWVSAQPPAARQRGAPHESGSLAQNRHRR